MLKVRPGVRSLCVEAGLTVQHRSQVRLDKGLSGHGVWQNQGVGIGMEAWTSHIIGM